MHNIEKIKTLTNNVQKSKEDLNAYKRNTNEDYSIPRAFSML